MEVRGDQRYIVKSSEAETRRSVSLPSTRAALLKRSRAFCFFSSVVAGGLDMGSK